MDEGTGIVHIAPGCGAEDFDLGKARDLPVLTPVDESGGFYPEYGWLAGPTTAEVAGRGRRGARRARPAGRATRRSRTAIPSAGAAIRR